MTHDLILYDLVKSIVKSLVVPGISEVYFFGGRKLQILKELNDLDNSITYKDRKYPFVAMEAPVPENRGRTDYYATVRIPRLVIASLSPFGTQSMDEQYSETGNFKTILYPIYNSLLIGLARSPRIVGAEPNKFLHTKLDNPAPTPIGEGTTDYVDSIEILNLELILHQLKTC